MKEKMRKNKRTKRKFNVLFSGINQFEYILPESMTGKCCLGILQLLKYWPHLQLDLSFWELTMKEVKWNNHDKWKWKIYSSNMKLYAKSEKETSSHQTIGDWV